MLKYGLYWIHLTGVNVRHDSFLEMREAVLEAIGFLHRYEFLHVLLLELNCLEGHKIQVADPTLTVQVQFDHVFAFFVSILQAIHPEEWTYGFVVSSDNGKRDGLAAETEHLHEHPASVLHTPVEAFRNHQQVRISFILILESMYLPFLLFRNHQIKRKPTKRLYFT